MEYYKTQSRSLEQFFFSHRIYFDHQEQSDDGMTVWVYIKDDYLLHVLEEWKLVISRKKMVPSKQALGDAKWTASRPVTPW